MNFNPSEHMLNLKGKQYLPVAWRLVWFREDHPKGQIMTEVIGLEPLILKATIASADGTILATAHASAVNKGNAVWAGRDIEKAETAAIGRALAHAGFGTQFDNEDEGDYLSDSPVERQQPSQNAPAQTQGKEPISILNGLLANDWKVFYEHLAPHVKSYKHGQNLVKLLIDEGSLDPGKHTVQEALQIALEHEASKEVQF